MKNGVKSTDVTDNATLSYKDKNNNEWKEWSDDVPQGIMTIKVGYGGRSEEERCITCRVSLHQKSSIEI